MAKKGRFTEYLFTDPDGSENRDHLEVRPRTYPCKQCDYPISADMTHCPNCGSMEQTHGFMMYLGVVVIIAMSVLAFKAMSWLITFLSSF